MNSLEPVCALVMAGGRFDARGEAAAGCAVKALAVVGGRTLLERALDALAAAELVSRAIVVGAEALRPFADRAGAMWTADTGTLLGNVQAGVRAAGASGNQPLLLFGADLAQPATSAIDDFIRRRRLGATVHVPLVDAADFARAYPGSPSVFVKLSDGRSVTIGSQFVAPAGLLLAPPTGVAALLGRRKSQIRMAVSLGPGFALALIFGRLTVPALEARASRLLGVAAVAVPDCAPSLAFDIDDARDLAYARSRAAG